MLLRVFNPSTRETGTGRSLSSRPSWCTEHVPGQSGLHRENVCPKNKQELFDRLRGCEERKGILKNHRKNNWVHIEINQKQKDKFDISPIIEDRACCSFIYLLTYLVLLREVFSV